MFILTEQLALQTAQVAIALAAPDQLWPSVFTQLGSLLKMWDIGFFHLVVDGLIFDTDEETLPSSKAVIPSNQLLAQTCGYLESKLEFGSGNIQGMVVLHTVLPILAERQAALRQIGQFGAMLAERYKNQRRDGLTGLEGRLEFAERLPVAIAQAWRQGYPLSLVMLDLDHLKRHNDQGGHCQGDRVLVALGQALKQGCRQADLAFRYGGDEFTLLMPGASGQQAYQVAERLAVQLRPLGITFSAGIAQLGEGESGADLFERADQALYQAKAAGRDSIRLAASLASSPSPLVVAGEAEMAPVTGSLGWQASILTALTTQPLQAGLESLKPG